MHIINILKVLYSVCSCPFVGVSMGRVLSKPSENQFDLCNRNVTVKLVARMILTHML